LISKGLQRTLQPFLRVGGGDRKHCGDFHLPTHRPVKAFRGFHQLFRPLAQYYGVTHDIPSTLQVAETAVMMHHVGKKGRFAVDSRLFGM
jgi:hypothetical protein